MGMDQQVSSMMDQGLTLFEDIAGFTSGQDKRPVQNPEAEARAGLMETDARGEARDALRRGRQAASDLRDDRERERAGQTARWGRSGLAMSGSKRLVRDASRTRDRQAEEELLDQGETESREALNRGRHKANLFRIDHGASPRRTTLSLGSNIYKYGGQK